MHKNRIKCIKLGGKIKKYEKIIENYLQNNWIVV